MMISIKSISLVFVGLFVFGLVVGVVGALEFVEEEYVSSSGCNAGYENKGSFIDAASTPMTHCVKSSEFVAGSEFMVNSKLEVSDCTSGSATSTFSGVGPAGEFLEIKICTESEVIDDETIPLIQDTRISLGNCPGGFSETGIFESLDGEHKHCVKVKTAEGSDSELPGGGTDGLPYVMGDGECDEENGEDIENSPYDCSEEDFSYEIGDGVCDVIGGETIENSPLDCSEEGEVCFYEDHAMTGFFPVPYEALWGHKACSRDRGEEWVCDDSVHPVECVGIGWMMWINPIACLFPKDCSSEYRFIDLRVNCCSGNVSAPAV